MTSPTLRPTRTRSRSPSIGRAAPCCIATAQRTASAGEANAAICPSPSHWSSSPPLAASASRSMRWWRSNTEPARSSPRRCMRAVESTTSVKRMVAIDEVMPLGPDRTAPQLVPHGREVCQRESRTRAHSREATSRVAARSLLRPGRPAQGLLLRLGALPREHALLRATRATALLAPDALDLLLARARRTPDACLQLLGEPAAGKEPVHRL